MWDWFGAIGWVGFSYTSMELDTGIKGHISEVWSFLGWVKWVFVGLVREDRFGFGFGWVQWVLLDWFVWHGRLQFYEFLNKEEIPAQECPETPGGGVSL